MRIFPYPAADTPRQIAIAARALRHRLGLALLASAIMLLLLIPLVFVPALRAPPDWLGVRGGVGRGIVLEVPIAIAVAALTHRLAGFGNVGLDRRGAWTSLGLSLPVLVLSLSEAKAVTLPSASTLVGVAILALFVAIVEEVYGRGLLVTLLGGRRHARLAIIGSSVLFAYLHMPIYVYRHGLVDALLRCSTSAAFSAVFATIRLRSGSLAGPIVFHGINDAQFFLSGDVNGEAALSARPMLVGGVIAFVYWFSCRRAILELDGARA